MPRAKPLGTPASPSPESRSTQPQTPPSHRGPRAPLPSSSGTSALPGDFVKAPSPHSRSVRAGPPSWGDGNASPRILGFSQGVLVCHCAKFFKLKKKSTKFSGRKMTFTKIYIPRGRGNERRLRHLHVRTEYLSPGTIKNLDLQNLYALKRSGS